MSLDLSKKTALIIEDGQFTHFAQRLAKDFVKVYYWTSYKHDWTNTRPKYIGYGIDNVEKVEDWEPYKDEADIIIFPDVGRGSCIEDLRAQGYRVFGGGAGERLEQDRVFCMKMQKKLGLDVPKYEEVEGLDNLRKYLKENDNKWIKIDQARGDFETWKSYNYKTSLSKLNTLEVLYGPIKNLVKFIVFEPIDDVVEAGMDLYTADGKYPSQFISGIEVKDRGFVASIMAYKDLPKQLTTFTDEVSDYLKSVKYRSFLSTEQRINKTKSFMSDATCRAPSPPSQLQMLMYKNISEIVWELAGGKCIDPVYEHKYGVQINIISEFAKEDWQMIDFPKKYAENVKLQHLCIVDGKNYCVPRGIKEIGAIVCEGDSIEEAEEMAKEIAEQVCGDEVKINCSVLEEAMEEADKLKEYGIKLF